MFLCVIKKSRLRLISIIQDPNKFASCDDPYRSEHPKVKNNNFETRLDSDSSVLTLLA